MEGGLALRTPTGAAAIGALGSSPDELGQVLALLEAAGVEDPGRLEVATGDRLLLELHRALTRRDVEVAVACASCGTINSAALSPESVPGEPSPRMVSLGPGGGLRAPRYEDLLGLPDDRPEAESELLRRCTVGEPARVPRAEELDEVDDTLTGPLVLGCVECGETIDVAADPEHLVLESLQRYAGEVELEIHLLARAYGWSLRTIEALPDERRRRLARLVDEGR